MNWSSTIAEPVHLSESKRERERERHREPTIQNTLAPTQKKEIKTPLHLSARSDICLVGYRQREKGEVTKWRDPGPLGP